MPAVVVTSSQVRDSISAAGFDAYKAAREMTRHLISMGHRSIGFIVGHPEHATSGLRLAGYRDAMSEAGLDCPDDYTAQGDYTYRSGLDAAERLLGLETKPTAIFAIVPAPNSGCPCIRNSSFRTREFSRLEMAEIDRIEAMKRGDP